MSTSARLSRRLSLYTHRALCLVTSFFAPRLRLSTHNVSVTCGEKRPFQPGHLSSHRPRLEHAEALKMLDLISHGVVPLRALWPFDCTIVGWIVIGVNTRKCKVLAVDPILYQESACA